MTQHAVLIAGAGIAGLALRRSLQDKGIGALVLERRTPSDDTGLAINLPGNAIAALRELGVGDALDRCGHPVMRREYRTGRGRLLFAVDERAFWGDALTPRCVLRRDLADMLLGEAGGTAVHWSEGVRSFQETPDGVQVATASGNTLRGRLLVGADGVHSVVRRSRPDASGRTPAAIAPSSLRFMAPNPGVDCWTLWAGAQALVLLIPVAADRVYVWVASNQHDRPCEGKGFLDGLRPHFPAPVRQVLDHILPHPGQLCPSPLDEVRLPSWHTARTVLIGDAAHATAPVWAQGAALALEDAITLSHLLAGRDDWTAVPADHERLRRPRVQHVQAMTDKMSRAAKLPNVVRTLLMPFVGPRSYAATYGPLRTPA